MMGIVRQLYNHVNNSWVIRPRLFLLIGLLTGSIAVASIVALNVIGGLTNNNQFEPARADGSVESIPTQSLLLSISNNATLSLPRSGGTISNYHDLNVQAVNITNGYSISLTTKANNNKLVHANNANKFIDSTTNTKSKPDKLNNNTWGYAVSPRNNVANFNPSAFSQVLPGNSTNNIDKQIASTDVNSTAHNIGAAYDSNSRYKDTVITDKYRVVYAIKVDNPSALVSGKYTATVQYTLTANSIPGPTISSISPSSFTVDEGKFVGDNKITITGKNLLSTYSVSVGNKECESISIISDTKISCWAPYLDPNKYDIGVYTLGGAIKRSGNVTYNELTCSANPSSTIKIDIDENMIPVWYEGYGGTDQSGWVKADTPDNNSGYNPWYDYNNKKWANAVTVKSPSKYTTAKPGTPIKTSDILGFWVYIPRYDYCVKRFNAADKVRQPENFKISFKQATDTKKIPTGNNTWATHPAFTWGDQELNGIWVGKFELSGSRIAPTVLPNKVSNANEYVGSFYNIIKSIGVEDKSNNGGGCLGTNYRNCLLHVGEYNQHNLNKSSSHMLKNSEWGAAAYLSASQYGAGVNKVQINAANAYGAGLKDDDNSSSQGITGCGPQTSGDTSSYTDNLTTTTCGNTDRQYTGTLGQLASTTNNVYGVYDMSGGLYEYVMGNYNNLHGYSPSVMTTMPTGKYINIYPNNPFQDDGYRTNYNHCTWQYCGGHALHETLTVQAVSSGGQSWGGDYSYFVHSNVPWAVRGGNSYNGPSAGVFSSYYRNGYADSIIGARAVLVSPLK